MITRHALASPKRAVAGLALLIAALALACTSAAAPTSTTAPPAENTAIPEVSPTADGPTSTPSVDPSPTATPKEASPTLAQSLIRGGVNLGDVPMVDLSVHSVPLEDVLFDTFDGRFVRLSEAPDRLIVSLRDALRPIYTPQYGDSEALPWLRDDDLVIGYEAEEKAFAYPLKVLNFRELVNDVIGGVPVLISYCPLCASGAVYSRELAGRTLLFGNTSALFESDLVLYDHQTGSYWFQILGEAIVGELTGERLTVLPAMTTTWSEWKSLHPGTRLLVSDGGEPFSEGYSRDPFMGLSDRVDRGDFTFPVSEDRLDGRLRAGELVITAELNSDVTAYPVSIIGTAAVNDRVGDTPVVIFSNGVNGSVFLATLEGDRLTFDSNQGVFVDRETGSTWNGAGRAVAGPLEGKELAPVPSRRAFWFSIAGALPGLELYLP